MATLAALIVEQNRGDPLAMARTLVLLPNRRAVAALTAAFVARSDPGVLLPAMRAVADLADSDDWPDAAPAIAPLARRFALGGLLVRSGTPPARALAEAADLARALGELVGHDRGAHDLATAVGDAAMAAHWQATLARLEAITHHWPAILAERGLVDPEAARAAAVRALARRWRTIGADGRRVIAAGIASAPPFVAELLHAVARLPDGLVIVPGLDQAMADAAWDSLGDGRPGADAHPQSALRLLLAALGVARAEVTEIGTPGPPHAAARAAAAARALDPAGFAAAVPALPLAGVTLLEAATAAEEAQAIALALRHALETPGRTAALVTPDRGLARRVAGHLARWGIVVDDSAGEALGLTPAGRFAGLLADAAANGFDPARTLAILDHPFAGGAARAAWRGPIRALDRGLRGLPPAPGLAGIATRLEQAERGWWDEVAAALAPLETDARRPLGDHVEALVAAATALAGDRMWAEADGRALAALLDQLGAESAPLGPVATADAAAILAVMMAETAVRPAFGTHPRLAIWGLLEARLQQADLMIVGGLNDGVWPAAVPPDPWLPPVARRALALPMPERRIGLAAGDFLAALAAPVVLLTRARRDATAPTVPSRFLLRLQALGGGVADDTLYLDLARALDTAQPPLPPAPRPAPAPAIRPHKIGVTDVDRLRTDPFDYYARRILLLDMLRPVGDRPTASDRGQWVHRLLEEWQKAGADPDRLVDHARRRTRARWRDHPLLLALWLPRIERAMEWAADAFRMRTVEGWTPIAAEATGELALDGITLTGRADRVDRHTDGRLAIIDYKTGAPPSGPQLVAGFATQLGLLGGMAEAGRLAGVAAAPLGGLGYWQLGGGRKTPGRASDPLTTKRDKERVWPDAAAFAADAFAALDDAIARFLLGDAPFTSKLHPEWAAHTHDYDQLARLDEWAGR